MDIDHFIGITETTTSPMNADFTSRHITYAYTHKRIEITNFGPFKKRKVFVLDETKLNGDWDFGFDSIIPLQPIVDLINSKRWICTVNPNRLMVFECVKWHLPWRRIIELFLFTRQEGA